MPIHFASRFDVETGMAVTMRFNSVLERDMDMLFASEIASNERFAEFVLNSAGVFSDSLQVESIELSKSDAELGESDITVVAICDGSRLGLLIEDKIDAAAMPMQHERYVKRGELGVKSGDYDSFRVIILCPRRYLEANNEAKLYESCLTYEEMLEFFQGDTAPAAPVAVQQIAKALSKARNPSNVTVNEGANEFLQLYRELQISSYPMLDLRTKPTSNGYWTDFATALPDSIVYHKIGDGLVDLHLFNSADRMADAGRVADWLRMHGLSGVRAVTAGKSATFRIDVPAFDVRKGAAAFDPEGLSDCLAAVCDLVDLAAVFASICTLADR